MKHQFKSALAAAALAFVAGSAVPANTVNVGLSNLPLDTRSQVRPNIVFGLDDSGSMDSEVLLPDANDGALWWDTAARRYWSTINGRRQPNFNCPGGTGGGKQDLAVQADLCQSGQSATDTRWAKFVYLFPNGGGGGNRIYSDGNWDHFAIAPVGSNAWLRSAQYNPVYFNPAIDYEPWSPAYIGGATVNYAAADPRAARSHPQAGGATHDLTADLRSEADGWTFRYVEGMTIPSGKVNGQQVRARCAAGASDACDDFDDGFADSSGLGADYLVPAGERWDLAIAYYPATYYTKVSDCADPAACPKPNPRCSGAKVCYQGYDGNWLLETRIAVGSAEMQNFANWFQYYRKRKLTLNASIGRVVQPISTLRAGVVRFNNRNDVTMYDFGAAAPSANAQAFLGQIYPVNGSGGTPTRETLQHIGQQYVNRDLIQYSCQVNAAMILTDGFATTANIAPPDYDRDRWMKGQPYENFPDGSSLADIAAAYYTLNLKPAMPTGRVPINPSDVRPAADKNSNLHMNTYALTLGALGTMYGRPGFQAINDDPYTPWPDGLAWPTPSLQRNPTSIDDLWHATINGRGQMFLATDPDSVTDAVQRMITDVLVKSGSLAAVTVSSIYAAQGTTVYRSSYNSNAWFGDLISNPVDNQGQVDTDTIHWSAAEALDARDPATRLIVTYDSDDRDAVEFTHADMDADLEALVEDAGNGVVDFLRGDRSREGGVYRRRIHVLGDIVNAQPAYVKGAQSLLPDPGYAQFAKAVQDRRPVLYQPANDGMLHAFDAGNGEELWAYVPSFVLGELKQLPRKDYQHRFYVDGTPVTADVDAENCAVSADANCNPDWHTLLVGGLRGGGRGYYALDVTAAGAANIGKAREKFLWEFPNADTPAATRDAVGQSHGRPVIVKHPRYGWIVLLTSGYNNAEVPAHGHLFVLDAASGELIADLPTGGGNTLAQVSAAISSPTSPYVTGVYGGDVDGNLWKFDLSGPAADWSVTRMTTLVDADGQPQPITAAPELGRIAGRTVVFVGTGRLLGDADLDGPQTQSFYALMDDARGYPIEPLRDALQEHVLALDAEGRPSLSSVAMDWGGKRGWYFDAALESGERFLSEPQLVQGALYVVGNAPSSTACDSRSFLYAFDFNSGNPLPAERFPAGQVWVREYLGETLASMPTIIQIVDRKLAALVHRADNTVATVALPGIVGGGIRRAGWREVVRE
jgi:type IV pilus assembly protein PilY1